MAYMIDIDVTKNIKEIRLGMQGENVADGVRFLVEEWMEEYGTGGRAYIYHRRAGDDQAYFRELSISDSTAQWIFTSADTAKSGKGYAQLMYMVGDTVTKSPVYRTVTDRSEGDATGPDPYGELAIDLLEEINAAAREALLASVAARDAEEMIENMAVSAVTVDPGVSASVTKTEEDDRFRLTFKIPKGDIGKGISSIALTEEYKLRVTYTDGSTWTSPASIQGPKGDSGTAEGLGLYVDSEGCLCQE